MIKLILIFFVFVVFAAVAMAKGDDEQLKIADVASDPESFAGRTIEVAAHVVAINADGRSLELFDSATHTQVSVQLAQLPRSERLALMRSDVRDVLVRGRVSMVAGRLTIHAESIQWNQKEAPKAEVVPVANYLF